MQAQLQKRQQPLKDRPPGPGFFAMMRALRRARGNQHELLLDVWREYGDIVQLGGSLLRRTWLVSEPEMIRHVLQDNNHNYHKGRGLQKAKVLVGEGLLTSEGEFWRRQRRLAQPAFLRQRINDFAQVMVNCTEQALESLEIAARTGQPVNLAAEMMHLTLDIVVRTMFTSALKPDEVQAVEEAMPFLLDLTTRRTTAMFDFWDWLPTATNRQAAAYRAQIDAVIRRIIRERRKSGREVPDLLGMLMAARDEDSGEGMTDDQLRDEAITIFLAGHETTANLMAWALFLLAQHPHAFEALREEVAQVLDVRLPTADDVPHLTYTRMILDETLRLYPPAWIFSRHSLGEDRLGDYRIAADTEVLISPYIMHRREDYWPEPEHFDPMRFDPGKENIYPRFIYLPFGAGPRLCIGNHFALMEATLILAMISQRFHFDLVPEKHVTPEVAFTLRPKSGVWMSVSRL